MLSKLVLLTLLPVPVLCSEAPIVYLWPDGAPGSEGKTAEESVRVTPSGEHAVSSIHRPSITVYLPPKESATGAAVVIAPGGGHAFLSIDHEGYNVGKWLAEHGIAGFVLKYRLAREKDSTYTVEGSALVDTQRAIRLVRNRASEWNIDPERIGVLGFSAGGELAALAATRPDSKIEGAPDPIDRESSKVAFEALLYPGIPHDMKVSKNTPPTFLVCGENDRKDISQGLPELYLALKLVGAPAELHIYTNTGHGFGLREGNHNPANTWPSRFYDFLQWRGLLKHQ